MFNCMFGESDIRKFYKRYVVLGFFVISIVGTLFHFVYDWCGQVWFVGLFVPVNESTWEHMKLLFIPMLIYIAVCFICAKKSEFMQSTNLKCKENSKGIINSNEKDKERIIGKMNGKEDSKETIIDKMNGNEDSKQEIKMECDELYKIVYTGLFGNIVGTWSIPFLFYGYKGILGFEVMWIDIGTFFIAVFIAFALQYHVLVNSYKKRTINCGKTLLIVNLIQFISFVLLTYHPLGFGIFVGPV